MNVYASVALSGDGYMDDRSPRRLILSTPADWREVMRLRAWADAILVGAETVRRDDPSLTVRDEALRRERLAANRPADPAKVTLSRSLRLAPASNFFTAGSGARIVFTDNAAASPLETAAEIVRIPDLSAARILTELEKRGFERLLVEGGPRTLGLFFAEGLVDTLRMAVNPAVRVGDPHAPRFEPPFDPARFPQQRRQLEGMEVTTYTLPRYRRTNQNTSVTLKPIVLTGDKVTKGQILTEGYSTQHGELALGRNLKVAFMPWKGYNFEDAIVISERIQREDIFTSVHVDEYIMEVRDTKRGVEELTSDIPNVSEDATKDLDANGIVRVGANIHPGDILIGKITPKGESDPSPEEKLLRAIFGDKAGDVKDASLKAQPSLHGVVIDTRLYSRANKEGKKSKSAEKAQLDKLDEKFAAEIAELTKRLVGKLWTLLQGKTSTGVTDYFGVELYPAGTKFSQKMLEEIARKSTDEKTGVVMGYLNLGSCNWTGDAHTDALIEATINNYTIEWKKADAAIKREKYNITNGDELPQTGVIQMAKVYIAKKRKLKVGDKMAGRHGNKGIVARIVRDEDMPFLEDGTIVDICLNPLGVPSRMNLGQIYETVLGWAGRELGLKFATPIFDGASLDQINEYTAKAGIPHSGRTYLYDGGTGEMFDQPATVGVIYMLKLGHMIDDKMHARSIGPYSLITQQPLGGKAQFGGQRFGEMEVWALEGFGAANILQEILTIKSDDVMGRAKAYEAIVKGENLPKPGIPEAMNVLLHELRGLALSVKLE